MRSNGTRRFSVWDPHLDVYGSRPGDPVNLLRCVVTVASVPRVIAPLVGTIASASSILF
jgi:hypothetical protein